MNAGSLERGEAHLRSLVVAGDALVEQDRNRTRLTFRPQEPLAERSTFALRIDRRVTDLTGHHEVRDHVDRTRALEMYDVEKLYVEKESMEARGMTEDDLNVPVEVKTSEEIGRLMEEQDVILSF